MNLALLLHQRALAEPDSKALYCGARLHSTHAQWARTAAQLATEFTAAGLQPGDRIALFMRNHVRYLELLLGAWWAGLVVVPINAKLHRQEAQWIINHAQARWVFTMADLTAHEDESSSAAPFQGIDRQIDIGSTQAQDLWCGGGAIHEASPSPDARASEGWPEPAPRAPDDLAWLFYTSGTTGRPKGVMLTHRNLRTMGMGYFVDVDPVSQTDHIAYAAPMSHGAGLYAIPHLMAGARHVVPESGGFDAAELFELGGQLGPLSLFAAPTIVNRIVAEAVHRRASPADCALAFKTIVYGGAPMYTADIQRALRVMGPRFVQIYGQGETPMTGTVLSRAHLRDQVHPGHLQRLASIGIPQTPVQVRIADEHGREVAAGTVGEVLIKGDTVMAGYWQNPEATEAAIRDGWLWTGDMGCRDDDGFITLKDRSKDLIISGGSNIYPREVEEVLLQAPGVAEVAVVGEPDPAWGEAVVAFVVRSSKDSSFDDPTASALDAWCLARIARYKRPKRYLFVDALPKNPYGKVLKRELRAQLQFPAPIRS